MRTSLWPDLAADEQSDELEALWAGECSGPYPTALFVADPGDGTLAGFVEVGMRSHADGCDPAVPVGYLEGWFVRESWRRQGVGRALVEAAEDWARSQGCREMASDTWIDQQLSQQAHAALGYEEVDRCVLFRKSL